MKRIYQYLERLSLWMYARFVRTDQWPVVVREVHVKKGDLRYTLLICRSKAGEVVYNIGRHGVNTLRNKIVKSCH